MASPPDSDETLRRALPDRVARHASGTVTGRFDAAAAVRSWLGRCFARRTLALEITLVLALKLAMLFVIKNAFFNQPRAPGFTLPAQTVSEALLGAPAAPTRREGAPQPTNHAN